MKILAGIITFNPDLHRLKENIDAIYYQVDQLLIIDNNSENIIEIEHLINCYDGCICINNNTNAGVAIGLKQIMDFAVKEDFAWVISLDQDSVCDKNIIKEYLRFINLNTVGIITCCITDRNMGQTHYLSKDKTYIDVKTCITSGSFMSVDKYKCVSGYDEKMFIDWVDFDICAQFIDAGFRIIRINYFGLLHEVGHGKVVNLLWKKYETYNHSPLRQYYMARNRLYVAKKYPSQFKYYKTVLAEIRECILILLYESDKKKKIVARVKGMLDAKYM